MSIYSNGKYLRDNASWHEEDSYWKAKQIRPLMLDHLLDVKSIAEIGCGAGGVLHELSKMPEFDGAEFVGYEVSPQALEIARSKESVRVKFLLEMPFDQPQRSYYDVALVIDVLEHVDDYPQFLRNIRTVAEYHVFHVPLEIHVSAILRKSFVKARRQLGHLHFFTAEMVLEALEEEGFKVIESRFTNGASALFWHHASIKRAIANIFRRSFEAVSISLSARLFGGYSLLVLAKNAQVEEGD